MPTESAHPGDDPRPLLSSTRDLIQRVRTDRRATWFPLLVFAALTFVSVPVDRDGRRWDLCGTLSTRPVCVTYNDAELAYWPLALLLASVGVGLFYEYRARVRGIGARRIGPYVFTGIAAAITLGAAVPVQCSDCGDVEPSGFVLLFRIAGPVVAIGLALLALAWTERNRPLLLFTLAYLTAVPARIIFGSTRFDPPWHVIASIAEGTVLLLGAVGFALAQRRQRTRRVTGHPAGSLDGPAEQRVRLGILAVAREARQVELGYLRDSLELTARDLSRHLAALDRTDRLVDVEERHARRRSRTWVTLTKAGRAALAREITQLELLIGRIEHRDAAPTR